MKSIIKNAFVNALAAAMYVVVVGAFLFYAPNFFRRSNTVLIPIVMLMLFVFSASFTGTLILGRPVIWYLEGRKKEALSLFVFTLGIFLIITIVALLSLILYVDR